MTILTIKTDQPQSEIGLYDGSKQINLHQWLAHRELLETLHKVIKQQLDRADLSLKDIEGIIVFQGPGSFTGLRIGVSCANALAYGLDIPIVSSSGRGWVQKGAKKLLNSENDKIALPTYGKKANVTKPRK